MSESCEHCGRSSRDELRDCDVCGAGMCHTCTILHDEGEASVCPGGVCSIEGCEEQPDTWCDSCGDTYCHDHTTMSEGGIACMGCAQGEAE